MYSPNIFSRIDDDDKPHTPKSLTPPTSPFLFLESPPILDIEEEEEPIVLGVKRTRPIDDESPRALALGPRALALDESPRAFDESPHALAASAFDVPSRALAASAFDVPSRALAASAFDESPRALLDVPSRALSSSTSSFPDESVSSSSYSSTITYYPFVWQDLKLINKLKNRKKRLGLGLGEDDDLYLDTSTIARAGRGLFTRHGKRKNQIITWYTGKVVGHEHIEDIKMERGGEGLSHTVTLSPMTFQIVGLREPREGDGAASFVNHSKSPNATIFYPNISEWGSTPIVVIKALRDIEPGEEIFINYGKDYWERGHYESFFYHYFC
jgi:hypothetical protein